MGPSNTVVWCFAEQDVQGTEHVLEAAWLARPASNSLIDENRTRNERPQMNFEEVLIAVHRLAVFGSLRTSIDDLVP